ncbi:hemagglutinin repeat-containing protein [Neisseria subflava]|uniref:hemagglutinin repeat-containing protein n=1 Tax=Neisseria subflava TaxID=28449 RepID=UPI00280C25E2|nr:hemagglutinin repeat-containing protein [Neisseria subflava]
MQDGSSAEAVGSSLTAGRHLSIRATEGSIEAKGAQISAEGDALLYARDDIRLLAAADSRRQTGSSKRSGFSIDNRDHITPLGQNAVENNALNRLDGFTPGERSLRARADKIYQNNPKGKDLYIRSYEAYELKASYLAAKEIVVGTWEGIRHPWDNTIVPLAEAVSSPVQTVNKVVMSYENWKPQLPKDYRYDPNIGKNNPNFNKELNKKIYDQDPRGIEAVKAREQVNKANRERIKKSPHSLVLEKDVHGNEIFYRRMSKEDFIKFKRTGVLPATSETFISPLTALCSGLTA